MCKCFFTAVLVALLAGMGRPASRIASERERSPTSNTIEGRRGASLMIESVEATPTPSKNTAPLQAAWRIVDTAEIWAKTAIDVRHAVP
ncbi:TPA: hypothetical protein ACWV5T_003237 [Salmonella enterica subsp. enterica serovar Muenchen]